MSTTLLVVAALISTLWGVGHILPTRGVVRGFGALSVHNRRVLVMEWVAEGLTLIFIGVLIGAVALWGADGGTSVLVLRLSAGMLLALAVLSAFTGARTPVLPMRLCPAVKSVTAILVIIATL